MKTTTKHAILWTALAAWLVMVFMILPVVSEVLVYSRLGYTQHAPDAPGMVTVVWFVLTVGIHLPLLVILPVAFAIAVLSRSRQVVDTHPASAIDGQGGVGTATRVIRSHPIPPPPPPRSKAEPPAIQDWAP